ncbi:hypothetical protein BD311DRAFT_688671, partial [Dichomitus squalens]
MSLPNEFDKPPQLTVGEAVDFFGQAFEGLHFIHEHQSHVAHCDCMRLNMMDPRDMFPDVSHPVLRKQDRNTTAKWRSRIMCPSRCYWTDFGVSCQFDADSANPLEIQIIGSDCSDPD